MNYLSCKSMSVPPSGQEAFGSVNALEKDTNFSMLLELKY